MLISACVRLSRTLIFLPRQGLARNALPMLALVALVALAQTGFAQSTLSLADAQRIAIERSRQLAAQDASITSSPEMAPAPGQLPHPVLKLGIDNLPLDGA